MRLAAFATDADIDEALRLFQVSTLDAATSGNLAGEWESMRHLGPRSSRMRSDTLCVVTNFSLRGVAVKRLT